MLLLLLYDILNICKLLICLEFMLYRNMASWTYVIHILIILLTLCLKLHLKYTSTRSEQISTHCQKKAHIPHWYIYMSSLILWLLLTFCGHICMLSSSWLIPSGSSKSGLLCWGKGDGSWELRVTPDWQGSALTIMGLVLLCSNHESRADPVRVSQELRRSQTNLPWPATSKEKAAKARGVRLGPREPGQGTGTAAWWLKWGAGAGPELGWALEPKGWGWPSEPQMRLLMAPLCRALCTALCPLAALSQHSPPAAPAEPPGSRGTTCRASWCTQGCDRYRVVCSGTTWIYPTCALPC